MRCKNCKEPFNPVRFNQKFCLKEECVRVWVESEKTKQWTKRKAKMKAELMTVQDYLKIAQQVFNKYIRLRDKGKPCISCQTKINGVSHASHYLSAGGHSNLRFNEDNVWVSCYKCNVMLSGNQSSYRIQLVKQIGIERVEYLESIANITKKWTIDELKNLIEIYKNKIKKIETN